MNDVPLSKVTSSTSSVLSLMGLPDWWIVIREMSAVWAGEKEGKRRTARRMGRRAAARRVGAPAEARSRGLGQGLGAFAWFGDGGRRGFGMGGLVVGLSLVRLRTGHGRRDKPAERGREREKRRAQGEEGAAGRSLRNGAAEGKEESAERRGGRGEKPAEWGRQREKPAERGG